jgi:hypothetical protein
MRIAKNLNKHVFCLEGDWEKDLSKEIEHHRFAEFCRRTAVFSISEELAAPRKT